MRYRQVIALRAIGHRAIAHGALQKFRDIWKYPPFWLKKHFAVTNVFDIRCVYEH